MMNAVEFLEAKTKMCSVYKQYNHCTGCPLGIQSGYLDETCESFMCGNPRVAVQIVEEWIKTESKITNFNKFKELFGDLPWQKYVAQDNCYATECMYPTPCVNCPWWRKEYRKNTEEE